MDNKPQHDPCPKCGGLVIDSEDWATSFRTKSRICVAPGCGWGTGSVERAPAIESPSKGQWICERCNCMNIGPICTKCGWVPEV
jgi:predicted RNA-binding Zn-ribbon protein involved in translation (DUF1610 family)